MQITQDEIVAIVLILAILWIWFTWDKTTEGFTDLTIPKGKKWGDYVYYEDDDRFPVASPSISHVDNIPYEPKQLIQKHEKINDVSGMSETPIISDHVAPFDDNFDFNDSLINKMNQDDNRSQDSIIHELPKSHDHLMHKEKAKQILTEKELMPGMEQKKKMEKSLEPTVELPVIKPKPKKKQKKRVTEDRYMALAILLTVLLVGFIQAK